VYAVRRQIDRKGNYTSGQAGKYAERISEVAPGIFKIVVPLPIPEVGSIILM